MTPIIALLTWASPAAAQKLPSAETGMVVFALQPKTAMPAPLQVNEGEVAWTETARPALVARLLDEVPVRSRPRKTEDVPSGATLFGFGPIGGTAYYAPIDPDAHNGRVQCFRDLDDDGTFDAGYVTRSHQSGSHYTPVYVQAIMTVPKHRYEKVDHQSALPIALAVVFRGMKKGGPVFRVEFEGNRNIRNTACEPLSEGGFAVISRAVAFTEGDGGKVALLAGESQAPYVVGLETDLFN